MQSQIVTTQYLPEKQIFLFTVPMVSTFGMKEGITQTLLAEPGRGPRVQWHWAGKKEIRFLARLWIERLWIERHFHIMEGDIDFTRVSPEIFHSHLLWEEQSQRQNHDTFGGCIRKHPSCPPASFVVSPLITITLTQDTSDTSGHQICGDFPPQQVILCYTSCVLHFNSYLTLSIQDRVRSHTLRA